MKNEKNEVVLGATVKVVGKNDSVLAEKVLLPGSYLSLAANQDYLLMITAAAVRSFRVLRMRASSAVQKCNY